MVSPRPSQLCCCLALVNAMAVPGDSFGKRLTGARIRVQQDIVKNGLKHAHARHLDLHFSGSCMRLLNHEQAKSCAVMVCHGACPDSEIQFAKSVERQPRSAVPAASLLWLQEAGSQLQRPLHSSPLYWQCQNIKHSTKNRTSEKEACYEQIVLALSFRSIGF